MLGACSTQENFGQMRTGVVANLENKVSTTATNADAPSAQQASQPGDPTSGQVLVLTPRCGGAEIHGNSQIKARHLQINSKDLSYALEMDGASKVFGDVSVVGKAKASQNQITGALEIGAEVMTDPLENLGDVPSTGLTMRSSSELVVNNNQTLSPGIYRGGIKITAQAKVNLKPGIYKIDRGALEVEGGATLTGTGVLVALDADECKAMLVTGNSKVKLSAIESGDYQGIALFKDNSRRSGQVSINGGGQVEVTGRIQGPGMDLEVTGNSQLIGFKSLTVRELKETGGALIAAAQ